MEDILDILIIITFILGIAISCGAGISMKEKEVYSKYCSQFEMEYNISLEACVNKDRSEIKKIEWMIN